MQSLLYLHGKLKGQSVTKYIYYCVHCEANFKQTFEILQKGKCELGVFESAGLEQIN